MRPLNRIKHELVDRHARIKPILPRGYHRYRVPGGRLYLDLRESSMMLARALHIYEPEKVAAFREHLRPGMTFVDVGANKGDFTLLAASLVGPSGRVISVEPGPTNQRWLQRSVAESGYRNVECVEAALGATPGTAILSLTALAGTRCCRDSRTVPTAKSKCKCGRLTSSRLQMPSRSTWKASRNRCYRARLGLSPIRACESRSLTYTLSLGRM
jgi:FkbM family methyltransferase